MNWWQGLSRTLTLGVMLLLGFADAGAKTERIRPYEIAGPAGLGSDEPLCRRLAAALNAEGSRELTAPRLDPLFARWQTVHYPDTQEIVLEATRADILNEGHDRVIYRITYLYAFDRHTQSFVFMRDESESLPPWPKPGQPSTWAEDVQSGRMFAVTNFLTWSSSPTLSNFLQQYPALKTPAGQRFRMPGYAQATDLILLDGGRSMVLLEDTEVRSAILLEINAGRPHPICYLS